MIDHNESIGLHASGAGARIHFRTGRVSRTRETTFVASMNAAAHYGAMLELRTFTLAEGEFAGVQYAADGIGASSDGEVRDHHIGANVQDDPLPFDVYCLLRGVAYRNNRINLDASSLPIPPPGTDPPPPPVCDAVPFVCDWCRPVP